MSASGSERTISRRRLAGIVPDPSFLTLAGHPHRMPNSKSVALMRRLESEASISRLDRMGMVVFLSTTPWVRFNSLKTSDFLAENSIGLISYQNHLSSRACEFVEKSKKN